MKQKELLEKEAREEFFSALKKFREEQRNYLDAKHKYYKTLEKLSDMFQADDLITKDYIDRLINENNISNLETGNYNSKKVFNYITSNIDRFFNIPDYAKNSIDILKIDNINKLASFSAIVSNDYILKYVIKNKKKDYIDKLIEPYINYSFGVIAFDDQVESIISLIINGNQCEQDAFIESLSEIKKLHLEIKDSKTSIIDYIKKHHCKKYMEQFKTLHFGFITSAVEKGIKENKAHKLFNLLCAYFLNSNCRIFIERNHYAKMLYTLAFIEMNYPNTIKTGDKEEKQNEK